MRCCVICEICRQNPCHPRCPNYIPQKASYYCSYCGEGIYNGEEYIENENNEYMHFECFDGMRDVISWLGYEVKTMNGETYE